jgi:WD40 repeat protein
LSRHPLQFLFNMITPPPYQVGGSLKKDDPHYVIRQADIDLYQALKAGEFCYILNSRQMGKSSLLVRAMTQLQAEGFCCTTLDMTQIGSENITPAQWYKSVVADLWRGLKLSGKLNLKTWWQDQEVEDISLVQRLRNFIEELLQQYFPSQNIIIFIDEIDSILSLSFPVDDFFALIRFCYNQRAINPNYNRLTFAIFGVATPSDLIADKKRTPFNIGRSIELQGFQFQDAIPLMLGLKTYTDQATAILKEILVWTGGQPFLTQKLCHLIQITAESSPEQKITIPPGMEAFWVESVVLSKMINKWESQDDPEHLRTIRDRILYNENRAGRLLGIYQQILQDEKIFIDDSREQIELVLSGLVVKKERFLVVKNRIYLEVFNLKWVKEKLSSLRPYSQAFNTWIASKQTDVSRLLRGQALKDAQNWARGKSLSDLDYQFLAISEELDRIEVQQALETARLQEVEAKLAEEEKRLKAEHQKLLQERKTARLQRLLLSVVNVAFVISCSLGLLAFWQYRQARISEIKALASSSDGLFASSRQLDAMIEAIKAKRRLQNVGMIDPETTEQVEKALSQTVYSNNEFNQLMGHQGSVLSVDISPDNQLIVTASNDKTVKIWKQDGTLLKTLNHQATVHRVAFSPNNNLIVSGSLDGTIKLWKVDGTLLKNIQAHKVAVWGVAFSTDGQLIASASSDRTVKIWTLEGQLLQSLVGHQKAVWNVAFSPDQQTIASAGTDGIVKLWNLKGQFLKNLEGHQAPVWDVAFCPHSHWLVSASSDNTAKVWNTEGKLVRTLSGDHAMLGVDCGDPFIATSGKDNVVKIWKLDGTFRRNLSGHQAIIREVALSHDGLIAASASDDGTVKLWQRNQSLLVPLYGHQDTIWDVANSPDGRVMASVGGDSVKLWLRDQTLWHTIQQQGIGFRSVAFSPNSRLLVTGNHNSLVELWDLGTSQSSQVKRLRSLVGHQAGIYTVTFSLDGKTIASAGDDLTIKIWNLEGKLLHSFVAHSERIWKLAYTPNQDSSDAILASASEDGTVKLWKPDGTLLHTLKGHNGAVWGVAWSPDGQVLATAGRDNTLKLWNREGTLIKTTFGKSQGLTRVAFSPDGQVLATGGVDNTVKLWNLQGQLLATLPGHHGISISVAFSADGNFLISGGDDSIAILWDLKQIRTLNPLEYACNWVRDYLRTNQEVSKNDRHLCDGVASPP